DHLEGVLFIDRLGPIKRRRLKSMLLKREKRE
ncbi:MAG: peptide deformylase, partial [Aquificota bacterium]